MSKIEIKGLKFHAFHGRHPLERRVGGIFEVDIEVEVDISKAAKSDKLEDALDYVRLMDIVSQEMKRRQNLIETVAVNICASAKQSSNSVKTVTTTVRKMSPPVSYELAYVSVTHSI